MDPMTAVCVAVGVGAFVTAPIVVPAVASAVGFTSAGVAAGSAAATMMSSAWTWGGVAVVSTMQSIGAAGLGVKGAAITGAVAYKVTELFTGK